MQTLWWCIIYAKCYNALISAVFYFFTVARQPQRLRPKGPAPAV